MTTSLATSYGRCLVGISEKWHSPWRSMRYCSACVIDDRKHTQGRECYWHRVHQAPGVQVCDKHHVWLEESRVPSWGAEAALVSAERARLTLKPRTVMSSLQSERLEAIAHESAYLLSIPHMPHVRDALDRNLEALFHEHVYFGPTGNIHAAYLAHDLISYYSADLLTTLGWRLSNAARQLRDHLAHIVLRKHFARGQYLRPLLTILIACYLRTSISALTQEPRRSASTHLGSADCDTDAEMKRWACVNPVCAYYQVPTACVHVLGSNGRRSRTTGRYRFYTRLSCVCGCRWTVNRESSSSTSASDLVIITDFGGQWTDELRRLWSDQSQTRQSIARRLHVSPQTITNYARRLELPIPRDEQQRGVLRTDATATKTDRRARRAQVLEFMRRYPNSKRKDLMKLHSGLYSWFLVRDRLWFDRQLPPRRITPIQARQPRRMPTLTSILSEAAANSAVGAIPSSLLHPGEACDAEVAQMVRATALRLIEEGRRAPIKWATLRKYIRELPQKRRRLETMPLTATAVREVTETGEQAAVRRIMTLGQGLAREARTRTRREVIRLAAAGAYRGRPTVQHALHVVCDGFAGDISPQELGGRA